MNSQVQRLGGANYDPAMSFEEIGKRLGIKKQTAGQICQNALKKLAKDKRAIEILREFSEYHHQLRARSAECRAAQEHF